MKSKYTKKKCSRDLGRAYKDVNNAYLKFMRPWNESIKIVKPDDMMFLMNLEIMKNGIEGLMKCWCGAIKEIHGLNK